jgi:Putative Ig domain
MDQLVATAALLRCERRAEGTSPSALRRSSHVFLSLLLGLTVVAGCTGEERHEGSPAVSHPPPNAPTNQSLVIQSAHLVPNPVQRNALVSVSVDKDEIHGQGLTYRYQWYVNGIAVYGATNVSFDPSSLRRGDVVTAEVVASNGQGESVPYKASPATVSNVPPTISRIVLEQNSSEGESRLLAKVEAVDADQDDIRYVYRWLRNNSMVKEGSENVLATTGLARKDIVTVEVTPYDLDGAGLPARAAPLAVGNNPPRILSQPSVVTNPEAYEYLVEAKDPDGDPVHFELESAPAGMTIDRATGRLNWKLSPALNGTHHVKLVVLDEEGGRGWQEFDLSLSLPAQPTGDAPARS